VDTDGKDIQLIHILTGGAASITVTGIATKSRQQGNTPSLTAFVT
jgi:hypothetical protein